MPRLSRDAARRAGEVVRKSERTPTFRAPEGQPPVIRGGCLYAVVTTAITAAVRGTSSLGKGAGDLKKVEYDGSGNATYSSLGPNVPLYSGALASIAVGRLVMVLPISGRFHVVTDFC